MMKNRQTASKPLYLVSNIAAIALSLIVCIGIFIVAIITSIQLAETKPSWQSLSPFLVPLIVLFSLAILLSIYSTVITYILLYKAWSVIQPSHPRTTPGKAVGFMFIPFFNLYWVLQAVAGYAKDYNAYASQTGITGFRLNEGLFLGCSILYIAACIPILRSLAGIALIIIGFICINSVCDAINHTVPPEAQTAAETIVAE